MAAKIQLTPAQHAILAHAHHHTDGKIVWFPDNIKGGARKKVLDGMFNRAVITRDGEGWSMAAEGYDALGVPRPGSGASQSSGSAQRRTRDNSKQAQVIAMLKRPEGATIAQIMDVTGWQQHTVRGTFAGAFKKKLGLEITSVQEPGHDRFYRIDAE